MSDKLKSIDLSEIDVGDKSSRTPTAAFDLGLGVTPAQGRQGNDHISNYLADLGATEGVDSPTADLGSDDTTGAGMELYTHSEAANDPRLAASGTGSSMEDSEPSGMMSGLNPYDYGSGDTGLESYEYNEPSKINMSAFAGEASSGLTGFNVKKSSASGTKNIVLILVFFVIVGLVGYALTDEEMFMSFFGEGDFALDFEEELKPVRRPRTVSQPVKNSAPQNPSNVAKVPGKPANPAAKDNSQPASSKPSKPVRAAPPTVAASQNNAKPVDLSVIKNPYWPLPNPIPAKPTVTATASSEDNEMWRIGLAHRYVYQHFKTTQGIRENFKRGAEVYLFQALKNKKFWVRMEALMALVENGFAVDVNSVATAIGNARSGLVSRYMRKIGASESLAREFVLRQAIRLVGATARLEILKALLKKRDNTTDLYFAASAFDPNDLVRNWMDRYWLGRSLPATARSQYRKIATDYLQTGSSGAKGMEIEVQELNANELSVSEMVRDVNFEEEKEQAPPTTLRTFEEEDDGFDSIFEN